MRRREGENGALRGRGFGPWTDAAILRELVGGISVEFEGEEVEGISRYAEPEAEGTMPVWRTAVGVSLSFEQGSRVQCKTLRGRESS